MGFFLAERPIGAPYFYQNKVVTQEKWDQLEQRMTRLEIQPDDLVEKFIRGSGSGGQKINKTSSCVYLKHGPSGIEVKCQLSRSRESNRLLAREELCRILEDQREKRKQAQRQATEKARRRNRPRPRKVKEKILRAKRKKSSIKRLRSRPTSDD
ncbi:MAG: protein subunit release factor B [Verrucomicrobiales bacterium]